MNTKPSNKVCKYCQEPILIGRSDKTFCCKKCQNEYNNSLFRQKAKFFEKIEKIIRSNYMILNKLLDDQRIEKVKREILLKNGYKQGFCTYVEKVDEWIIYNIRLVEINSNYYEITRV